MQHFHLARRQRLEEVPAVAAGCGARVIERDWYELGTWQLTESGSCRNCGKQIAGVFSGPPGAWAARRLGVRLKTL
ncbi:MAG: hypothetical protein ACT4O5_16030 [Gammaproteobacteria bacterium]